MSIAQINEQLLRAIGVGIALLDAETLKFNFQNDTFVDWFSPVSDQVTIEDLFPQIDTEKLILELRLEKNFTIKTVLQKQLKNFI